MCKHNHLYLTLLKAKYKQTGNVSRKQECFWNSTINSLHSQAKGNAKSRHNSDEVIEKIFSK